jgi:hypothetical protein
VSRELPIFVLVNCFCVVKHDLRYVYMLHLSIVYDSYSGV